MTFKAMYDNCEGGGSHSNLHCTFFLHVCTSVTYFDYFSQLCLLYNGMTAKNTAMFLEDENDAVTEGTAEELTQSC
jgi:hypothetical protein